MADLTAILAHKNFEYPNNIYFKYLQNDCFLNKIKDIKIDIL